MSQFYKLRVYEKRQLTEDAVSLHLERPTEFLYQAGQHLPIRVFIRGKEVRRTCTLSSSPIEIDYLTITVKRVTDGLVSNYINDHITSATRKRFIEDLVRKGGVVY